MVKNYLNINQSFERLNIEIISFSYTLIYNLRRFERSSITDHFWHYLFYKLIPHKKTAFITSFKYRTTT